VDVFFWNTVYKVYKTPKKLAFSFVSCHLLVTLDMLLAVCSTFGWYLIISSQRKVCEHSVKKQWKAGVCFDVFFKTGQRWCVTACTLVAVVILSSGGQLLSCVLVVRRIRVKTLRTVVCCIVYRSYTFIWAALSES